MTAGKRRAVFLDRDGVVIAAIVLDGKPYAATSAEDVSILPGVPEACGQLSALGFLLILTTNQPDIARGKISADFVAQTNAMLQQTLGLDAVRVCPHDNSDGCDCRKPLPGLMTHAAEDFGIDLGASFVVGDRWRDVEAGKNAGCRTVFIDCNYDEALKSPPDHIATSLLDAAAWIARTA
jgi:D-glycero-D-manno-heptose 1,7-bisphosphate phosphatase